MSKMFDVKHRDADKTRSCYVFGGLDGLQNYARGQVGCVSVKQVYPLDSLIEFTGGSVGGVHDRVLNMDRNWWLFYICP